MIMTIRKRLTKSLMKLGEQNRKIEEKNIITTRKAHDLWPSR